MAFENYKHKDSLVIVYTGKGKGKTSASLGLLVRALGAGKSVAYIQFIKHWQVSEHEFIAKIQQLYPKKLYFFKGGKGFYKAGELSAKDVTTAQHRQAAAKTYEKALEATTSGKYHVVVCDEINNAVHDGLLKQSQLKQLIENKHAKTTLCLTGRNFPKLLLKYADIATNMTKIKHHFDDKYLAEKGIDY